ncbi:MAG TPA: class I SAM-dependent methyltransferase [Candidatus Binataceae bacterium]|nr:class I SAM-dependent methyltransferase [Candidatus Binataceae bacterium]
MANENPQLDWGRVKQFSMQVGMDVSAAMLTAMSYIGDRLGLFRALADAGTVTSARFAELTGLNERYLREWLSAMTAAGYITYDSSAKTFSMPPEHAMVLAREESPFFSGGFIEMLVPNLSVVARVMESFRKGGGVSQSEYPPETWEGIERLTAPMYRHHLVQQWLPAMTGMVEKLNAGGSALDVGCGSGRAAITMAQAFPKAKVAGFDAHLGSVERARSNAKAAGVADRVAFEVADCTKLPAAQFDLITACDVVHDSVDPIGLLRSIRSALKAGGASLLVEMNVSSKLEENINPMGRMLYSVSTLYCMTTSLAHNGAGIGACMGEAKARELASTAGFTKFRRLPIDDLFSALFELQA